MGPQGGVLLLLFPLPCLLSAQLSTVSGPDHPSLDLTPTPFPTVQNTSITTGESLDTSILPTSQGPTVNVNDNQSAAETYLYTGELSSLTGSICTQTFQLPVQQGSPPRDLFPFVHQAVASLTNAANFLNLIFQASELRETSVREDIEWYHALVRALLEGDRPGLVRRAFLMFDADPTIQQPQLVLRASKDSTQDILLQDLTSVWSSLLPPAPDHSWFNSFKSGSPPLHALSKQILLNDLSTLDTPKWARGDSYVMNSSGVQWEGSPFLECVDGRFLPGWLISLSMPFYGLKPDLSPEFRGVIRVDMNIQGFSVDQCASGDFWFANTHKCNRTSMECVPIPQQGFRMGQYCCRCKKGYYSPIPYIQSKMAGGSRVNGTQACYPEIPVCLPCWPGCDQCEDGAPCCVQEDWLLRSGVLAVQGLFMVLVLISMLVAYQCRRTKWIRTSGLLLLEMILCGSLLLYFPVFILCFKPSTFRCILLRWVRLLGFAIVYGTVMLKMYRVLKVFLSRTAQRVPYITTTGVLRILGVIVLTVSWFLCAWTVGVLQNRDRNVPLLIISTTSEGQGFNLCDLDRWDYMMAVAELLFLCWGSFLCSAVKTVPSAFHEPRYMTIAIHNELLLSSLFHLLRFVQPSLHPDWMLLLFFTHTHVTISVTLSLLFIPKFLYMSRSGREEIAAEVYEDEVELRRSCSYLNSSFTSNCCSDHSLDPDDIRDELKKLYAQLEVHKTKRITNNNPHLSKKRSSRLSIGRSLIKRITEIPESLSRQCSREDKDVNSAIGTVSRAGSYYKSPNTTSINRTNESLTQPSPKLRKSHSTCAPRRDSLLNSSIKSTADKRASQLSDVGSINTTLLVCKSASAHNLTADTNLLLPEPTRFQKSLSVIERNGHRSLTPCRSIENVSLGAKAVPAEKRQKNVDINIQKQTSSALLSESFDKAEVCPWEVLEEQTSNKNQKHVTYSLANQEEPKSPDALSSPKLLYVCPWEFLPPPSSPVTENGNGIQTDANSTKPALPISCSAPGSPNTVLGKPKEFQVFSFRTATQSLLVAKGIGEAGRSLSREKSFQESDVKEGTLQKSLSTSMRLSLGSAASNKRTSQPQRRAMTTVEIKPCLVKQAAVRLPSTDSTERSPKHSAPVHICPWESEEVILVVKKQNEDVLHRQYSDKQALSATLSKDCYKPSGFQPKSFLTIPNAEVCPWDVPKPFHQTSISEVCPWEVVEELQIKSVQTDVCPWEMDSAPSSDAKDNTCSDSVQKQAHVKPEVCRSYILDMNESVVRQEYTKNPSDSIKPGERVIYVQAENSPGDHETAESGACSSEAHETQKQECDFPEPPSPITDTSLWESEPNTKDTSNSSIVVIEFDKSGEMASTKERESVHEDVCPWETSEPGKTLQKQESVRTEVCPWEAVEPVKTLQKQESVRTEVCPGEVDEPVKTLQKQESVLTEVCPWEGDEPVKTLQKQESVRVDICPWETEVPVKSLQKQESVLADVCPWETSEPVKTFQKQERVHTEVCPWENEASLHKEESVREDVCPWETGEPSKTLQKQESAYSDVCPWDAKQSLKEPEGHIYASTSTRQNSIQEKDMETPEDTRIPTEMGDRGVIQPADTRDEMSVNSPLARCDALCPWDMERGRQESVPVHDNMDVFTWEETILEEDDGNAESAAEAFIFPPDM
ncbi:probable G-protein coupled receptor 158 [Triplophysa rosa]|uniref:G-protein coupled receptor 179 n=1 Tax=Triplophysa rosa TaxID=992332 RepID=A0A9W7WEX7_TRIRA|nr:probable G-protein coupled receptor 158 [Triplophysa rosa]KAI7795243.1 putative G-protein coupled receptor 179 [Triplophysa rosa]